MENIIEIKNVHKKFKGVEIFTNINISIEKNTTVGIVGSNGSGKSVFFNLICGFLQPDKGEISIRGEKIGEKFDFPPKTGIIINEPGFLSYCSGFNNLLYLAKIQNIIDKEEIKKYMSIVGLDPNLKTKVGDYSLGMKKKLAIAQAIMEGQELLILDEPFNGLDINSYKSIKELIKTLKVNKTILLTSHTYTDLEELCDTIYHINDNKITILEEENKAFYK